jgi:N,N'-diacetyllegionaminate synthase
MKEKIDNLFAQSSAPVFVIAEIGINHNGSFDEAVRLVKSAAKTGCDAVKFQTYITEKRTKKDSGIFDILKKCELPFDDFVRLQKVCHDCGVGFFSTPFDEESLDFLVDLQVPLLKLASFDVTHLTYLEKVVEKKVPVILSTGISEFWEIARAVDLFGRSGCPLALLHCVSSYPTEPRDANLNAISSLKRHFDLPVGHSDHTADIQIPLYAAAMGAAILEKHYCVSKEDSCVDGPVSISEEQMANLVRLLRELEAAKGDGSLSIRGPEESMRGFRRQSQG